MKYQHHRKESYKQWQHFVTRSRTFNDNVNPMPLSTINISLNYRRFPKLNHASGYQNTSHANTCREPQELAQCTCHVRAFQASAVQVRRRGVSGSRTGICVNCLCRVSRPRQCQRLRITSGGGGLPFCAMRTVTGKEAN